MATVLIVEDHPDWRKKIAQRMKRLKVVGQAFDGLEAVALAMETHPDIIVMDDKIPGLIGLEAAEQIAQQLPETIIVMYSTSNVQFKGRGIKKSFSTINELEGYLLSLLDESH